ncbi:MAG: hydantoinase B/oxoprolinase family protein [Pontiellaceae bacterium]|nr:hydantoinase B/oxoprolinase family protein [Pontiellaceae bacterium]MBN2784024.1 hydantoinase B/oxoprolinase family protein [Pontiellaceae bacterium]
MANEQWEFWIDVGGTFTDCIARAPSNELVTCKVLSSGVTKGQGTADGNMLHDPARSESDGFWTGYTLHLLNESGAVIHSATVRDFSSGRLYFKAGEPPAIRAAAGPSAQCTYELTSGEESPLLAIRSILGLRIDQPIPQCSVRLGTTRGTNALLERRGARTLFVTTKGFGDVLLIGNQDRPRLFDLAIEKPSPLFERVVEVDERILADGTVEKAPDEAVLLKQLIDVKAEGIDSIAICLLHSFANPANEEVVERIARAAGFDEVSTSSRLSPLIKIVSRGDTTVMDAYLNPILRDYVRNLRRALPDSRLKMMTSAGGLVDADYFVGKDSILSGPAGGVIGFSRVAQRAGFERSIGFDMGGTSTDVSRFDGTYEREFETKKAGVRIVAPMLAIETVAAGGGSLCGFDGVKLHVGPQSAGADPGPACYGRGGPLTVTDINLYLGRIIPSRFPFPLDRNAVESRLQELCAEIAASPLGKRYTSVELAEGFRQIANANMVRAIRSISVAKGYDPADYALVTFGGAGAQHACEIARALGMQRILIHPFAGILSAYGIGLADVRRFREHSVLAPCLPETLSGLESVFLEMENAARDEVRREGIAEADIAPAIRSLDMRYVGVDTTINVSSDGDYVAKYEQLHRRLYGYIHEGRGIEIVAARIEVIGRTPDPIEPADKPEPRTPEPSGTADVIFGGVVHETAVFYRESLRPGDRIHGPAIVCEPVSTVVVDPGFSAEISERGELVLTDCASSEPTVHMDAAPDPVHLEIFNSLFASIAEQMGITLQQTSISTNVKERLDFSCAIFDPAGGLVVNAPHIPVHLGAMGETVKRILADNPDMAPCDVFVTNDPYRGGSHLPDVTVITPVHDESTGELLFFTASRAHHAEIGGIVPGSMPPFSRNLSEEGVLIRNFKLVDRGTSREEALQELLRSGPYPSRAVHDNLSDVAAQVAANNSGVQQLRQLVMRYGLRVVQAYMRHIQQAAEEKMRLVLRAMPDGEYAMTDHLDSGAVICASIRIEGDCATVDFTGTSAPLGPVTDPAIDPSGCNLNANRAITTSAVLYAFRCLIDEDIPLNSGVLHPVKIMLPECLLNPPERDNAVDCAAVVGGNVETSQRVVDVLLGALKVAAASQGTMNNLTFGDETFGYYETICGGSGATHDADGADAVHTHMTNTRLTDAEVLERRYPVLVREFSIRRGSGGAGEHCGGDGLVRRLEFLRPLKVSILSERRGDYTPFGLDGGASGQRGENRLLRAGLTKTLPGKVQLSVDAGDQLMIETPGGGGFGVISS